MSIILYFILFIFLFFLFAVFSLGFSILRLFKKRPRQGTNSNTHNKATDSDGTSHSQGGKKVFGDDEGEYVDYEEVE